MSESIEALRSRYPITRSGLFLNHAATAPVSARTIDRLKHAVDEMAEPLGKHFYQSLGALEETRRRLAELIGAHPSELAFSSNTSTALSLIAQAIPFQKGDRVLVPSDEFPSNLYVWQNLAQKGVECTQFDVKADEPIVETLSRLNLDRVRLITISSVSYLTGRRYELNDFTAFCRARNILSCFDAIQEIGTAPVNVRATGVDFLAGGAQKWLLGPIGCGFFYARAELLPSLHVPYVGWTSVKYAENFSLRKLDFATEMTRFEPGLPNLMPIMGLNESLRELEEIGWTRIHSLLRQNTLAVERAIDELGLPRLASKTEAGIVSFRLPPTVNVHELNERLHKAEITVTQRESYMRVSPHFYTSQSEIDQFAAFMAKELGRAPTKAAAPHAPEFTARTSSGAPRALLVGATGILGIQIARQLAKSGWHLTLIAKEREPLDALARELGANARAFAIDLANSNDVEKRLNECLAADDKFEALINTAGIVASDIFTSLTQEKLDELFRVNVLAPAALMRIFLTRRKSDRAQGILNIVSSSGRCGYPLLSAYGGTAGALWTLSESVHREVAASGLHVTTFVAPAMHSRMQKQMGRTALRYFKMSGVFDYDHPEEVAAAAIAAFAEKKAVVVPRVNRVKLWLNSVLPSVMDNRIAKVWRV